MLKKILKSNRGSALLFVLIAITVLSMLGISLMSYALSGLKVKLAERDAKESQYLSESGLDLAYTLISEVVLDAVKAGRDEVDYFISNEDDDADPEDSLVKFIEMEREKERNGEEDSEYIEGDTGVGPVNEDKLKEKFNEKFKEQYKAYVDENLLPTLEDISNYMEFYDDDSNLVISCDRDSYVKFGSGEEASVITLESSYKVNNITKQIAVDFRIAAPDYDQEYTVETVSEIKKESPLFDKALAADGNIIVKSTNVNIEGDIFAGGDNDDPESHGLALGDEEASLRGSLSVKGRIFTGGDIRINSSNSSLEAYGDIFCSNIRFMDVKDGSIKVGSAGEGFNVHTLNGIIVDGTNSHLDIYGKYYGFSRGEGFGINRSTILINDQYASAGSDTRINITGEATSCDKFPDGTSKPSGNVIAGSNFVPFGLTRIAEADGNYYQVLYQTGESIAIIGNYEAYSKPLNEEYPKAPEENPYNYNKDNIIYENISSNDAVPAIGFKDDGSGSRRLFGGSDPVLEAAGDGKRYKLYKGILDKSYYFKYAYDETPDSEKPDFRFDSIKGIKNIIYSTGAYPWFNEASGKMEVKAGKWTDEDESVLPLLPDFRDEYYYYINELGNPQLDYKDSSDSVRKSVADFVDEDLEIDTDFAHAQSRQELFYCGGEDIAIGSDADVNSSIPYGVTKRYNVDEIKAGIVYTKGDVYITGRLDYTGTIIAEGDIYILGSGTKTIRNKGGEGGFSVAKKAYEDFLDRYSQGIGDIFELTVVNVHTEYKGSTPGEENIYINFKDIITTSNWRRIR